MHALEVYALFICFNNRKLVLRVLPLLKFILFLSKNSSFIKTVLTKKNRKKLAFLKTHAVEVLIGID